MKRNGCKQNKQQKNVSGNNNTKYFTEVWEINTNMRIKHNEGMKTVEDTSVKLIFTSL